MISGENTLCEALFFIFLKTTFSYPDTSDVYGSLTRSIPWIPENFRTSCEKGISWVLEFPSFLNHLIYTALKQFRTEDKPLSENNVIFNVSIIRGLKHWLLSRGNIRWALDLMRSNVENTSEYTIWITYFYCLNFIVHGAYKRRFILSNVHRGQPFVFPTNLPSAWHDSKGRVRDFYGSTLFRLGTPYP